MFVTLPVHRRFRRIENLHSVHSDVESMRAWVFRDHQRQRDERSRVERPGREDGKLCEVRRSHQHLVNAPFANDLRDSVRERSESQRSAKLADERSRRRGDIDQLADSIADLVEVRSV